MQSGNFMNDGHVNVIEATAARESPASSSEASVLTTAIGSADCGTLVMLILPRAEHSIVPVLSELQHCNIDIQGRSEPLKSQKDNGAQICLIKQKLIRDLDIPTPGVVGWVSQWMLDLPVNDDTSSFFSSIIVSVVFDCGHLLVINSAGMLSTLCFICISS